MHIQPERRGMIFALSAYIFWGLTPVYFKLIQQVPATEILAHRMIWSFCFMLLLLTLFRSWPHVQQTWRQKKKVLQLAVTAIAITGNWLLYIWAINNGHMLESSLGYFINPLVNMLLGFLFLGERFRPVQWCAICLALFGVGLQLWQFGSLPVIALGLAFSFGLYGLLRKKVAVDAQAGMFFETLWLLLPAILYLSFFADSPTSHLTHNPWSLNLMLLAAGAVTMTPLLLFTIAASHLRLSTLGFLQYIAPTTVMVLAVMVYGEEMSSDKMVTFVFIWLALLVFTLDALYTQRRIQRIPSISNRGG